MNHPVYTRIILFYYQSPSLPAAEAFVDTDKSYIL